MAKPISVPTLCDLYAKDPSQMRKMIDQLGIKKIRVRRPQDNRVVTAISDDDHQFLVDNFPNLTAGKATTKDISLSEAAERLGYRSDQLSNFTRLCKNREFEIYEKKFKGRTQKCISMKNFKEIEKVRNAIALVDVD